MDPEVDPIKCTWKLGDKIEDSPHIHEPFRPMAKKIFDDVLDAIGNTPMIKINKVGNKNGVQCELLAKCEFMNMGGSVKVRFLLTFRIELEREWSLMQKKKEH